MNEIKAINSKSRNTTLIFGIISILFLIGILVKLFV